MGYQHFKLAIMSMVLTLVASSHMFRPLVSSGGGSSAGESDFEIDQGNGTTPCRWSFSKSYSDVGGSSEINVEFIKVLRCGNETNEVTGTPTAMSGPTLSPVDDTAAPVATIPVTRSPITPSPVTNAPISSAPVTSSPVITAPITSAPVTSAPVTTAPDDSVVNTALPPVDDTAAPAATIPVTTSSITPSPVTNAPIYSVPVTSSPVITAPFTSAPVTTAPIPTASGAVAPVAPVGTAVPAVLAVPVATVATVATVCPGYLDDQRLAGLIKQAFSVSNQDDFLDMNSPQFAAIQWILDDDESKLCPGDGTFVQRYVLATLYFGTNGDGWNNCTRAEASVSTPCSDGAARFLSSASECTWLGCQCDSSGSLSRINIDWTNLQGPIPNEIGALSNLFELDLDHNALTGTIPSSIGQLSNLVYLDLDENNLRSTVPEEIYGLPLLRALDLDTNMLTGTISTRIGQLDDLYIAQFDYNQMNGTIPSEVGFLDKLEYFTIVGNDFNGSIPEALCGSDVIVFASCELCAVESCCSDCA
jgi:hypothetical protein